jgi:RND family efflux transporter MFP subunit
MGAVTGDVLALQTPVSSDPSDSKSSQAMHNLAVSTLKRRRPKAIFVWLLSIVAAGLALGWYLNADRQDHREGLPETTRVAGREDGAIPVTVEQVRFRPVQRTVDAVGTLHGFEEITLSAKVEGRVRKIDHDMSDRVKPGELLIQIDPTDYQLSVQQAEGALQVELAKLGLKEPPAPQFDLARVPTVEQSRARLDNAQAKLDRQRRLLTSRAVSTEEFDNITSDYRAAQAEFSNQQMIARSGLATIQMKQTMLAVARQQMHDTEIHAPTPSQAVPGAGANVTYAITQRSVSEGTYVRPGAEVCRLVLDQTLKLRVPVPERHSAEVKEGQRVQVTCAAFATPFEGKLTRVNPSVDPTTRTFEVEIQIVNPDGKLKPGGFAKAAILTRLEPEAATVPLSALSTFAGVTKIFLAEHGRARAVPVTLGVQTTDWVEIASPALSRHADVITSGLTLLATNTSIAVRESVNKPINQSGAVDEPKTDRQEAHP